MYVLRDRESDRKRDPQTSGIRNDEPADSTALETQEVCESARRVPSATDALRFEEKCMPLTNARARLRSDVPSRRVEQALSRFEPIAPTAHDRRVAAEAPAR